MNDDGVRALWEASSVNYNGLEYASIREEIAKDLASGNVLDNGKTLLDIGCGPGLYEYLFSSMVASIHCTDYSPGMIGRLKTECARRGLSNITVEIIAWEDMMPYNKYDIVFSSLCPALNDPGSLLRMEKFSEEWCVYISSANPQPSMAAEVWSRIGSECSFRGYDTHYPYAFLKMRGRRPTIKFYSTSSEITQTRDEACCSLIRYMSNYCSITSEIERIIYGVVDSHASCGTVKQVRRLTLGMIFWHIQ